MSTTRSSPIPKDVLVASGEGAPSPEEKLQVVSVLRKQGPRMARELDSFLIEQATNGRRDAREARSHAREMESLIDKLTEPPLILANHLGLVETAAGLCALVQHGNTCRVVPMAGTIDPGALQVGDEVLLNQDLSVLTGSCPVPAMVRGETASFECLLSDDRMLVRSHDESVVIGIAGALRGESWESGDRVRWDRAAGLAFEKIEKTENDRFVIGDVPEVTLAQVGGQAEVLGELIGTLTMVLTRPDVARRYGLDGQQAVLLVGRPGNGKTLMAKAAASEIRRLSGQDCRICVVKPGEFESPYVGETQRIIRECFSAARACEGFVLLFLDEIETIGRARGGLTARHSDKFLGALLAELQGFHTDSDEKIAVVAATNRRDLLDPALVDRLEVQLEVKPPDQRGAREIFAIHLGAQLPYSPDGNQAPATRSALIDRAVSRFYCPNGDNAVCTVRFSDSTERVVTARDLVSGRCFEQVCRAARRGAAFREVQGGDGGVRIADIDEALAVTLAKMSSLLTRANIRSYLPDLPQDMEITAVEPVVRKVVNPHRYLDSD